MAQPTVNGIFVSWTFIKTLVDNHNLMVHYTEDPKKYNIQIYNGSTLYKTALFKTGISVGGDGFNQTQNDSDRTDFLNNYEAGANGLERTAIRIESDEEISVNVSNTPFGNKLRYDQMTKNQTISKTTYTTIYSYNGSGKICGAYLNFSDKSMEIKLTIDGEDIFADFDIEDLPKNNKGGDASPFITRSADKEVKITFPDAVTYTTSVILSVKSGKNNKKLSLGYVVLTKES